MSCYPHGMGAHVWYSANPFVCAKIGSMCMMWSKTVPPPPHSRHIFRRVTVDIVTSPVHDGANLVCIIVKFMADVWLIESDYMGKKIQHEWYKTNCIIYQPHEMENFQFQGIWASVSLNTSSCVSMFMWCYPASQRLWVLFWTFKVLKPAVIQSTAGYITVPNLSAVLHMDIWMSPFVHVEGFQPHTCMLRNDSWIAFMKFCFLK